MKLSGAAQILKERHEQMMKHGRTLEHDAEFNKEGQLSHAARWLLFNECEEDEGEIMRDHCPKGWDMYIWLRMLQKPYKERIVIAGALLAAEIDRLDGLISLDLLNNLLEGVESDNDEHQA